MTKSNLLERIRGRIGDVFGEMAEIEQKRELTFAEAYKDLVGREIAIRRGKSNEIINATEALEICKRFEKTIQDCKGDVEYGMKKYELAKVAVTLDHFQNLRLTARQTIETLDADMERRLAEYRSKRMEAQQAEQDAISGVTHANDAINEIRRTYVSPQLSEVNTRRKELNTDIQRTKAMMASAGFGSQLPILPIEQIPESVELGKVEERIEKLLVHPQPMRPDVIDMLQRAQDKRGELLRAIEREKERHGRMAVVIEKQKELDRLTAEADRLQQSGLDDVLATAE